MNKIVSQKCGFSPDFVEEKTLNDEKFREIYDFHRLVKVRKFAERCERSDIKSDRCFHKKLRSPFKIGEKVLVLAAERLKKKDAPGTLFKRTTENMPFFNYEQIFIVRKVLPKIDSYDYWISKTEDGVIIDKRFLRQKLFVLTNQFI